MKCFHPKYVFEYFSIIYWTLIETVFVYNKICNVKFIEHGTNLKLDKMQKAHFPL